jgi:hypothetical protein
MAAELAAMQEQVQRTPGKVLVSNHCMGFFEIAALYLSIDPPRLADARLAIDAFAGVIDALGPRLDEAEKPMNDALAQLRLGYLEAGGTAGGEPD